jgi:hypothetical protein
MMLRIAAVDGAVSLDEQKILRRMARAFGLNADALEILLREDESFREVVVEGAGVKRAQGEAIPRPCPASTTFALNQERIAALTV